MDDAQERPRAWVYGVSVETTENRLGWLPPKTQIPKRRLAEMQKMRRQLSSKRSDMPNVKSSVM